MVSPAPAGPLPSSAAPVEPGSHREVWCPSDFRDTMFRHLHTQLLAEHNREVEELAAEIARLRCHSSIEVGAVGFEYMARVAATDQPSDLIAIPPTLLHEEVRSSSKGSNKAHGRSFSKNTGVSPRWDSNLETVVHVDSHPTAERSMSKRTAKRKGTGAPRDLAGSAACSNGEGAQDALELWPEWSQEGHEGLKLSGAARRRSLDRKFSDHLSRRSKARYSRTNKNCETATIASAEDIGTIKFPQRRRCCSRKLLPLLPLHPGSRQKLTWDFVGLALLIYDIVAIPFQVCFQPTSNLISDALGWFALLFWTCDIPLSFVSGYYHKDGKAEQSYRRIAVRYLTSWFPLDVIIVGADWLSSILDYATGQASGDGVGLARMGKFVRIARILRTLRLLRLAKIRQLMYVIEERIQSEYISILGGLVQQVAGLLALNHLFACLWWLVGTSSGTPNWAEKSRLTQEEVLLQYLVSLHWSLTQFTPASMEVVPVNIQERGFNVVVLIFAMVVFSSFVSSITSAMTRLRTLKANEVAQTYLLKKYLRENCISSDLSSRVTRYIDLVLEVHKRKTDRSKVELLQMLSGPLNLELQREVYAPYLAMHYYFEEYNSASPSAMGHLCFTAVSKFALSKGDTLFHLGSESNVMFFLVSGTLFYRRAKGIKNVKRMVIVDQGLTFCEAALWVPWVHRGTMKALIESDVVALDSQKFREVTLAHPDVTWHAQRYAKVFQRETKEEIQAHGIVWDLPSEYMHDATITASEVSGATSEKNSRDWPEESENVQEVKGAEKLEAMLMESSSSEEEDEDGAPGGIDESQGTGNSA